MRSALIIGAAGQDGRLLTPLLAQRGYAVRGWTQPESVASASFDWAAIDILDAACVERELRSLQPDEIYYLAAFHHASEDAVEISADELLRRSLEVHVNGLRNVLEAMKTCCPRARLFYAASSHVFGAPGGEWQDEQTPFAPESAYGISKVAGIECCQTYGQRDGLFAATGILFNHESALRKPSFLSQKIVRGALQAHRDPAYRMTLGDLDAAADWGYASDYVEAMWRILQLPEPSDFVVASGELHTVREFAQTAFDALGLDWRRHVETDARLLRRTSAPMRGDSTKLRVATGWSPSVSFVELVARLVHEAETTLQTEVAS
ncbi:MAG TPA: GDP-mannose 4,6-dehydratase [Chthoniobacterales bacterium]